MSRYVPLLASTRLKQMQAANACLLLTPEKVRCKDCRQAKPWLIHGGISVECLAKGVHGYAWEHERDCGAFERKEAAL